MANFTSTVLGKVIIAGTLTASITLGAISWSGTGDLENMKNKAKDLKQEIVTLDNNATSMVEKFNLFKSSVQDLLNNKIDRINELQDQLATAQGNGQATKEELDVLADETVRLTQELTKANDETSQASTDVNDTTASAKAISQASKTSADMDTTLALHQENGTGTQTPQAPQEPITIVPTTYSTLFNDIKTKDSSAQSTPQENVIYVSIGNGSSQFNTVQELTDYMDTYQQTHDVPSGIQFKWQNSSNEVVYTTN